MKIYTKYGDKGKTKLYGGDTVDKTHVRVEAYGTVDELTSLIGLIISEIKESKEKDKIAFLIEECEEIQQKLFDCGSDLATPRELRPYKQNMEDVEWLEKKIDEYMPQLPKLESFIIPGGHKISSMFHQARTMTRRLERRIVAVVLENENINEAGQKYINRLSDYFFVVARLVNLKLNIEDTLYKRSAKVFKS